MINPKTFGEKLKNIRKEKNLTQKEVAEKLFISVQAVSKWEKGKCLPDVDNIKTLGQLYQISVDNLLKTEDDMYENIPPGMIVVLETLADYYTQSSKTPTKGGKTHEN